MDNDIHFGLKISELIAERNFTKTDAAGRLGYTLTGLMKVLAKQDVSTEILKKVCSSLDADMSYFLSNKGGVIQKGRANVAGAGNVQYKGSNNSIGADPVKMEKLQTENEHLKEQNKLLKEMVEILKAKG